jgi:hypothetical protein
VGTVHDRPAPPDRSKISLLARRLIGVREDVLDWVPEDRPRYTRLGIIVVNTGLMAAVSLFTALTRVVSAPWPVVIPVALFWGFLVLSIDSWMVSSTHGSLGSSRWLMFIPRLVMAVLLGSVIAEPLVLWFFHPAIHTNVEQFRQSQIQAETGLWTKCNSTDGRDTTSLAGCSNHQLGTEGPAGAQTTLARLQQQRTTLNAEVVSLIRQLDDKQSLAQKECAGVKIGQTTGLQGWGPRCQKAWSVATDFEKQADLPAKRDKITALDGQINSLTHTVGTAQQSYAATIQQGITQKDQEFRSSFGKIDIIDEARGLERLSSRSGFVRSAQWLVRILLILVDSLPVLAKILGGTTYYDRLVSRQLKAGRGFHELDLSHAEHAANAETKASMDEIDNRSRLERERHDEDLEDEIDRRASRYAVAMQ